MGFSLNIEQENEKDDIIGGNSRLINTRIFGDLEIEEDKVLTFNEGLPGLEEMINFVLIDLEQTKPFLWLQSIEEDIALPVISPFEIDPNYAPTIDNDVFRELDITKQEDLLVLVVAVIPPQVNLMTANMAAPILINIRSNAGRQALATNDYYQVRQPIFEKILKKVTGEENDARSDTKG